jgi:membrane protein DedA with SNARE-associated domain
MGYCEDKNVHTVMILSYPTLFLIYCLLLSMLIMGAVKTVGAIDGEGGNVEDVGNTAGPLSSILNAITSWIVNYGYPAVFAAALIENLFPPIPSEVIFPLVGFVAYSQNLGIEHAIGMSMTGALGSTVGAIIIYFISLRIGKSAILRLGMYIHVGESTIERSEAWFDKHGSVAVFIGRMAPGIREIISIPAGLSKMNLPKFIVFTFAGSSIWSIALTLIGYLLGEAWNTFSDQLSSIFNVIAILILLGIAIIFVARYYHNNRNKRTKREA